MSWLDWKKLFDACMFFRHGETIDKGVDDLYKVGKNPLDAASEIAEIMKLERIDHRLG